MGREGGGENMKNMYYAISSLDLFLFDLLFEVSPSSKPTFGNLILD